MKTGRGKRVAMWTVALGVAVLAATGYALLRERIREEHWLRQLDRGDETARKVAAERLGELRSMKAIPLLVREVPVLQDRSSDAVTKATTDLIRDDILSSTSLVGVRERVEEAVWSLNWAGQALVKIGPVATPYILDAIRGITVATPSIVDVLRDIVTSATNRPRPKLVLWLEMTLSRMVRTWGEPTLPWLRARSVDADPRIRDLAGAAYLLLLEHESGATRKAAVAVAQEFPATRVRSRVRYMADRDPDGDVRVAASGAWERLRASDGPER